MRQLREKKLSMYQNFINLGEVEGYFERAQMYLYLNSQILSHSERKNVCVKIEGGVDHPFISYEIRNREETVFYKEEKQGKKYVFTKVS